MSFFAPWVHRLLPKASGWLLAVLPLALFGFFAGEIAPVAAGAAFSSSCPWVPSLGVTLSFYLDGLSMLFSLLILGIGVLVLIYSSEYLKGHHDLGRFYAFMLLFMSSMLGLVLADNMITLFVFWELTSFSSFLLIGFEHEREAARKAALQALLVTGAGGLALLAGFLLLGHAAGGMELSALQGQGDLIRSHGLYLPILLLILAGAFTKSAQFPFHLWLPSAMEAPTPVSAYLHSATMVTAGVYLLARLSPVLGGTDAWFGLVAGTGVVTMLAGAVLALAQKDLKRILAYSTVSGLGTMVLLLGLNSESAAKAALVFLLLHALYKGALFLVAGVVHHETGMRDVDRLGGLYRVMPVVAAAAVLAALSMAGVPPLLGFIGKELLYEATLQAPLAVGLITGSAVFANVALVAVAGVAGVGPFFGRSGGKEHECEKDDRRHCGSGVPAAIAEVGRGRNAAPTEADPARSHVPAGLWLGPVLLSGLGLVAGIAPGAVATYLISPALGAVRGHTALIELSLWHGVNPVFLLGAATVICGAGVYAGRHPLHRLALRCKPAAAFGPARWYDLALDGTLSLARLQTRLLQSGYLRYYLMTVLGAAFLLVFGTMAARTGFRGVAGWPQAMFHEWLIASLILMAAFFAATSGSRLATVAALGVVGYGVALIFILFGAPDLAMTQFCIETLSIILFVLVLYRLPRFSILSPKRGRARDVIIACANGGIMTLLVLTATSEPVHSRISLFFARNSVARAHGQNVVNVILVDFRALDTLGEITVLAVASLGVYALLKGRAEKGDK